MLVVEGLDAGYGEAGDPAHDARTDGTRLGDGADDHRDEHNRHQSHLDEEPDALPFEPAIANIDH